jgi:SAM-dependent methyltransferase
LAKKTTDKGERFAGAMTQDEQQVIWAERARTTSVETVVNGYHQPCVFQREFADYVNGLGAAMQSEGRIKCCEMGSEFGSTTLLLSEKVFERHAVDLNPRAIQLFEAAAAALGQRVYGHVEDMFHTRWPDETFDIVFSNGVHEHYEFAERVAALEESARITRKGGLVLLGVPNHDSLPYRFAYQLRRALRRWPFPPENKISILSRELAEVKLLQHRTVRWFDQEAAFAFLPRPRVTSIPFRLMHRLKRIEPYLRVFEMARL